MSELDKVYCPGCAAGLKKRNGGECPHCGYENPDGPLMTLRELLEAPDDMPPLDDVSPAFLRRVYEAGKVPSMGE